MFGFREKKKRVPKTRMAKISDVSTSLPFVEHERRVSSRVSRTFPVLLWECVDGEVTGEITRLGITDDIDADCDCVGLFLIR